MPGPPLLSLNSGQKMPQIGLGIHQVSEEEMRPAISTALDAGYRYFDSSFLYKKEEVLGKILEEELAKEKVSRKELFVLSKLPQNGMNEEAVERFIRKSLSRLRLDYLDMYLIHFPTGTVNTGVDEETHPLDKDGFLLQDFNTDLVKVWSAMEECVYKGLVKGIGLSNFNIDQIKRIMTKCRIVPANVQVEVNVLHQNTELVTFCKENNIAVTAYAPLGSPGRYNFKSTVVFPEDEDTKVVTSLLHCSEVARIAQEMQCSSAQVLLHYLTQSLGVIVIPKSTNPARIKENINIFGLEMSREQAEVLRNMNRNLRSFKANVFKGADKHPEFPF